jgi:hypothetical protein
VKGFKTTVLLEDAAFTGVNSSFGTLQIEACRSSRTTDARA